jgi:hypothetical protein
VDDPDDHVDSAQEVDMDEKDTANNLGEASDKKEVKSTEKQNPHRSTHTIMNKPARIMNNV